MSKEYKGNEDVEKIDEYIEKQIEMKLNNLLKTLPDKLPKEYNQKPIYEYTIAELYKNTLQSIIDILNELTDLYNNRKNYGNETFNMQLYNIFLKDNRKIYLGIIIIFLSLIIYFIDGVSV